MMRGMNTREKCPLTRIYFNREESCQSVFHSSAERVLLQWFWSSDKLTGSQTKATPNWPEVTFWSSDKLTGSQTIKRCLVFSTGFGAVTN